MCVCADVTGGQREGEAEAGAAAHSREDRTLWDAVRWVSRFVTPGSLGNSVQWKRKQGMSVLSLEVACSWLCFLLNVKENLLLKYLIFRASFLCWGHNHLWPDELLRLRIISSLFLAKLFPVSSPKRAILIQIITTPPLCAKGVQKPDCRPLACASLWCRGTHIRGTGHVLISTRWKQSSWCFYQTAGFNTLSFTGGVVIYSLIC